MEKSLSFSLIESFSYLAEKNELFEQYTNEAIPKQFDSNYMLLKFNPTLIEFKIIEQLQKDFQSSINQHHLKFLWPENTGLFIEVLDYLNKQTYEVGMQELMVLLPSQYRIDKINDSVRVEPVTNLNLKQFLQMNYEEDLTISKELADHKQVVYRYQYEQPHVQFLLAFEDTEVAGSMALISSNDYLEFDQVLTRASFRKKRVASTMMYRVLNELNPTDKPVILVVDAEDTPKELYLKRGFKTVSSQISVQKVF